ncbi:cytochrome b [Magnetospirillum sulfuroxidans]|uniref:Cytochrome b n=1 Tax=Magnetospirillum sulfuroxidans TaxID=611300 RepID=A0ABS5IAH4_9PROT|nr:cytochrome b [Magnetospirillum sulfuroxidans]MBR9971426.1 cytochrome b [Magnetospirillum sulfuroxidans]
MNSAARYDAVAMALHWLMALMIIGLWSLGLVLEDLPKGDFRSQMFGLHISMGTIILVLTFARLGWRLARPTPELPAAMVGLERLAAGAAHIGLYALMVGLPLAGILLVETGGRPLSVFGLQVLPALMEKSEVLHDAFEGIHSAFAWILAVLVAGHALAALRHHFLLKDDVLSRMLPGGK